MKEQESTGTEGSGRGGRPAELRAPGWEAGRGARWCNYGFWAGLDRGWQLRGGVIRVRGRLGTPEVEAGIPNRNE